MKIEVLIEHPHILALVIGFALDKVLGDPVRLPHPIVAFGKMISFVEKRLNKGANRREKGMLTALFLIISVFAFFSLLMPMLFDVNSILGIAIEAIFVFYGIAGTTLMREGKGVFEALERGLDAGRKQVGRIVGRDTAQLSEQEIKAATLETLAENLSDGVVAPLFWFAVAGVPGIMTYKMVNTLDSMIGYKSERYLHFGRFAARFDDLANFISARITAILMALCEMSGKAFVFIKKFGRAHSSPNAGYPEAALAGILNVQFGGTHNYFGKAVEKPVIGENKRDYTTEDLKITIQNMRKVEVAFLLICVVVIWGFGLPF